MAREKVVRVVTVPVLGQVVLITREQFELLKCGWADPKDLKTKGNGK